MSIFKRSKKEQVKGSKQKSLLPSKRLQLNMNVDRRLKKELQRLAIQYSVPRDTLGEHVLQIGCFYMDRGKDNDKSFKEIRQHLNDVHQIASKLNDTEAILRISEGGDISELLKKVDPILFYLEALNRAMAIARQTGNPGNMDNIDKQLRRSVIDLAMWLDGHDVDDLGD